MQVRTVRIRPVRSSTLDAHKVREIVADMAEIHIVGELAAIAAIHGVKVKLVWVREDIKPAGRRALEELAAAYIVALVAINGTGE